MPVCVIFRPCYSITESILRPLTTLEKGMLDRMTTTDGFRLCTPLRQESCQTKNTGFTLSTTANTAYSVSILLMKQTENNRLSAIFCRLIQCKTTYYCVACTVFSMGRPAFALSELPGRSVDLMETRRMTFLLCRMS